MVKEKHIMIGLIIIAIIVLIRAYLGKKKRDESGYYYSNVAEYSKYPELTGNPIADRAILNQAGYRYDHS